VILFFVRFNVGQTITIRRVTCIRRRWSSSFVTTFETCVRRSTAWTRCSSISTVRPPATAQCCCGTSTPTDS